MRNILITSGIILVIIGLLLPWIERVPLGKLPGDIIINKPGAKIFFPITTMIIISIILSIIMWLFRK